MSTATAPPPSGLLAQAATNLHQQVLTADACAVDWQSVTSGPGTRNTVDTKWTRYMDKNQTLGATINVSGAQIVDKMVECRPKASNHRRQSLVFYGSKNLAFALDSLILNLCHVVRELWAYGYTAGRQKPYYHSKRAYCLLPCVCCLQGIGVPTRAQGACLARFRTRALKGHYVI